MKTITIDKKKVKNMDDLIIEINKGFKNFSFAIDSMDKRIDAQHTMIQDIHQNYVTKNDFGRLEKEISGLREDMSMLLTYFKEDEEE